MKKQYQSLIIDSNLDDVDNLAQQLTISRLFAPSGIAENTMSAYQYLCQHPVDLVFMDAEVNDKPSLELLALLPNHPPVIVVSAHSSYAAACFDLNVVDFVQKPFTFQRLCRAISRALPAATATEELKPKTALATVSRDSIYLKIGRKTERFTLDDIVYIEAYGIYIKVHTRHALVVANEKISKIEHLLPNDQFIRIHKSCVINLAAITRIESRTIWIDKTQLIIGITFQDKIHKMLRQLAIEK